MTPRAGGAGWGFVGRLAATLVAAAIMVLAATRFVARPWRVSGPSMEPTLYDGDRVIVELGALHRRDPRPGDVVLFDAPPPRGRLVKRVAGGPYPGPEFGTTVYGVLGDNLPESLDSREFGTIGRERIVGRVVFRYWPLSRAGTIE